MTKTTDTPKKSRPSRSKAAVAARASAKQIDAVELVEGKQIVNPVADALLKSLETTVLNRDKTITSLQSDLNYQTQLYNDIKGRYDELLPRLEIAEEKAGLADAALVKIAELQADLFCREVSLPRLGDILMIDQASLRGHIANGMPLIHYVATDDGKPPQDPHASVADVVAWFSRQAEQIINSQKCEIDSLRKDLSKAKALADREERSHLQTLDQRDKAQDIADKLAHAIGGRAVGEHSTANDPYMSALEMASAWTTGSKGLVGEIAASETKVNALRSELDALRSRSLWARLLNR